MKRAEVARCDDHSWRVDVFNRPSPTPERAISSRLGTPNPVYFTTHEAAMLFALAEVGLTPKRKQ